MRKNKMGAIFLISVLALAGIGISYAGWTDQITVSGTVATGSVNLNIVKTSGTWVWKVIDTHELVYHHTWVNDANPLKDPQGYYDANGQVLPGYILVAYAVAYKTPTVDDSLTVTYNNLFPCQNYIADAVFHYDGTIPARVNVNNWGWTITTLESDWPAGEPDPYTWDWVQYLITEGEIMGHMYFTTDPTGVTDPAQMPDNGVVELGTQLHYCNYIKLDLRIHLPQENRLMLRSATLTYTLNVIQFDEYT